MKMKKKDDQNRTQEEEDREEDLEEVISSSEGAQLLGRLALISSFFQPPGRCHLLTNLVQSHPG